MSGLVLSLFPGIGLLDMAFEEEGLSAHRTSLASRRLMTLWGTA